MRRHPRARLLQPQLPQLGAKFLRPLPLFVVLRGRQLLGQDLPGLGVGAGGQDLHGANLDDGLAQGGFGEAGEGEGRRAVRDEARAREVAGQGPGYGGAWGAVREAGAEGGEEARAAEGCEGVGVAAGRGG